MSQTIYNLNQNFMYVALKKNDIHDHDQLSRQRSVDIFDAR